MYVSDVQPTGNVHLSVTGGLSPGSTVRWIRNGSLLTSVTVSGPSYESTISVPLDGALTYARAEVRDPAGVLLAMTGPIFFSDVASLPGGIGYHVDQVTTSSGTGYTKV